MQYLSGLLPISVVAAIIIFVVREILEAVKKGRVDARKRQALNTIFLALCERNLWVVRQVQKAARIIDVALKAQNTTTIKGSTVRNNHFQFRVHKGGAWSGGSIPPVHISQIEKHLMDAALLDREFFKKAIEAHDAVLEIEHLRSSLIEYMEMWNRDEDKYILESFYGYVAKEVPEIVSRLEALAVVSGGKPPIKPRVR